MTFADVEARTDTPGFSAGERATILAAMKTAYDGSATARGMFEDWIATPANKITIEPAAGLFRQKPDNMGGFVPGTVEVDLSFLDDNNYIDNNGAAVEDTLVTGLIHELVHALEDLDDNTDVGAGEYRGDTVKFANRIYQELGLPEQNSYLAYDSVGDILTRDFEYTKGSAIDRSWAFDADHNSSPSGDSKDLLIGGPSANILQSGDGDDFLFGGGGDDDLNGGNGTDTGVLSGMPADYDVRLNADGTWTSRYVRGAADEGTDTFSNLEKVQFEDGETFDLAKNGLTFQNDFAFVVDQTGSMFDDIDAVKASASAVVSALFADDTMDTRIGVVGFRDNTIGEPTEVILPFTDQDDFADREAAALAAIDALTASGGGDTPETAFDGLLTALDGSMGEWREGAGTKRIVLFTDAPAKDAFLLPTVLAFALDIGADISAAASAPLGSFGSVDTFELSFQGAAARDLISEGDPVPPFVPTDDPVTPLGGTATVQIFTIFIETFATPDPSLEEISALSGGTVLTAADPEEVVERLLEVITSASHQLSVDPASVVEGDDGTTEVTYTLIRDRPDDASEVTFATTGTADSADVSGAPASVSFAVGETEKTITVLVNGDLVDEDDETFGLQITGIDEPSLFNDAPVEFTILDDDAPDDIFRVEVTKNVTITKTVDLTVLKSVNSTVDLTGRLATAEASADAIDPENSLAETDSFAQVDSSGAFSFSEALAASGGPDTIAGFEVDTNPAGLGAPGLAELDSDDAAGDAMIDADPELIAILSGIDEASLIEENAPLLL
ncbi:MAG TPA: VWA domain-containing protein [Kiloniellaceae bacterium]|nr:VWA domain-containing protein [Kiloniellaceae bacterium]